uniref:F-box domain-containing protein n=1 Tax=Panagrolaimus sp. PS1159 TaxID=55785 RepID=A0AC35G4S1_9BILA
MQFRGQKIIPSLPDVVLLRIFKNLSYKELCLAEVVCRRWQNLIHGKFRKECKELVVEHMGYYHIEASLNCALERLTLSCPFNSDEFLSGVMRRHHGWLKSLVCDVSFLANVGKLKLKKDTRKKFFTGCDNLWIVMLQCSDELLKEFAAIEDMLFLDLKHVTLQIHLMGDIVTNAAELLRLLKDRSPGITVSVELQATVSHKVIQQIACLNEIHLKSLKIICIELDHTPLKLDEVSEICEKRKISYDHIGFRDWYLHANPDVPLARHHVDCFRISSCKIANVDSLISSLAVNQRQINIRRIVEKTEKENIKDAEKKAAAAVIPQKNFTKIFGFTVKKVKKTELIPEEFKEIPIENSEPNLTKLEVAGNCEFCNFSFLGQMGKNEFEYRVLSQIEKIQLDISQLYFYD